MLDTVLFQNIYKTKQEEAVFGLFKATQPKTGYLSFVLLQIIYKANPISIDIFL